MILHPVFYRAVFRYPIGPLNPMGLKIPVAMTIEIYEARKGAWKAREKDTGKDRPLERVTVSGTPGGAKTAVAACFTEQCQDWQPWAKDLSGKLRVIEPEEIEDRNGKMWLKEPEKAKAPASRKKAVNG